MTPEKSFSVRFDCVLNNAIDYKKEKFHLETQSESILCPVATDRLFRVEIFTFEHL